MRAQGVARNLLAQEPGRVNRHAEAAATPKISEAKAKRHNSGAVCITAHEADKALIIAPEDRTPWALTNRRDVPRAERFEWCSTVQKVGVKAAQIARLRLRFGLTPAQATLLAALAYGEDAR